MSSREIIVIVYRTWRIERNPAVFFRLLKSSAPAALTLRKPPHTIGRVEVGKRESKND
jgi:hypothetical protein